MNNIEIKRPKIECIIHRLTDKDSAKGWDLDNEKLKYANGRLLQHKKTRKQNNTKWKILTES